MFGFKEQGRVVMRSHVYRVVSYYVAKSVKHGRLGLGEMALLF
jgi:hypothetical protein